MTKKRNDRLLILIRVEEDARVRKIILIILLIPLLFMLDFYYVNKAMDFSRIYPFHRVFKENNFVYKVDFKKDIIPEGSVIIKIEDAPVDEKNFISTLKKYGEKKELRVAYRHNGLQETKTIVKEDINKGYLTYLLLLFIIRECLFHLGTFYFYDKSLSVSREDLFRR